MLSTGKEVARSMGNEWRRFCATGGGTLASNSTFVQFPGIPGAGRIAALNKKIVTPCAPRYGGKGDGLLRLAAFHQNIPETLLFDGRLLPSVTSPLGRRPTQEKLAKELVPSIPHIRDSLEVLGVSGGLIAIRSSGHEDHTSHTAAGLYRTKFAFLDASDEVIANAMAEVLLSSDSDNARAFYKRYGISEPYFSLMIQSVATDVEFFKERLGIELYAPAYSGVIDTSDPNRVSLMIAPGLGTTVVEGTRCYWGFSKRDGSTFVGPPDWKPYILQGIKKTDEGSAEIVTVRITHDFGDHFHGSRSRDLTARLVQAAVKLEGTVQKPVGAPDDYRVSADVEFTIPTAKDFESGKFLIVQHRPTRMLLKNFRLPNVHDLQFTSRSVIGQGHAKSRDVVIGYNLHTDEDRERLRAINSRCRLEKGYVLVLAFPGDAPQESGMVVDQLAQRWRERFEYECRSKAAAIIVVDCSAYLGFPTARIEGDHLAGHFAQFLRSSGVPFIVADLNSISESGIGRHVIKAIKDNGANGSQLSELRFQRPLCVAVDQVGIQGKMQGIVGEV